MLSRASSFSSSRTTLVRRRTVSATPATTTTTTTTTLFASSSSYSVRSFTLSSSSSPSSHRLVISRRAWQAIKETLPPKPPPSPKPKAENKPWPRSVQIAGYVGGGVLIPYLAIWLITSNPTLRNVLGPFLPMDKFRSHFGSLEWDVQSYVDEMETGEENEVVNVEYYQFPDEPSFRDRQQQKKIDALNETDVKVAIYVSDSDGHQSEELKTVPANVRANAKSVLELAKGMTGESSSSGSTVSVAVDFEDDEEKSSESSGLMADDVLLDGSSELDSKATIHPLLKETQTFSSWFYVPQQQPTQEKAPSTPDIDMDISRLEYTVSQLEKSLKDPTCTRDMDDMAAELRQAKRELSGLKWKRRLGFSR